MSSRKPAPKRATKAVKAKPTLKQMLLRLDEDHQVLMANQTKLEQRADGINLVVGSHSNQIVNLEKVSRGTCGRVEKLEAKVFPADPTPEDWQKAAEADYEQRLEAWRKQFRTWIESVLRSGSSIPASVPAEHLEKAYGKGWKKIVGDVAQPTPPNIPREHFGPVFGTDWGAPGGSHTVGGVAFKPLGEDPDGWKAFLREQRRADAKHRQASDTWEKRQEAKQPRYRKDQSTRATLVAKVQQFALHVAGMPPSDAWHQLYSVVAAGRGYDPRAEVGPEECPLDVVERKGDLQWCLRHMYAQLERWDAL